MNQDSENWWIVEDALCDRSGHWFEYIQTFQRGLSKQGKDCVVFSDRNADTWLVDSLKTHPVLPRSIWKRMGDNAPKWKRLLRIPAHGLATYLAVRKLLKFSPRTTVGQRLESPDIIFVPTVLVHHLLGWWLLLKGPLRHSSAKLLLFFPNTPVNLDADGTPHFNPDPSARLFGWLIKKIAPFVQSGKVVLGAETEPMVSAMTKVTGVPFTYFPHPVHLPTANDDTSTSHSNAPSLLGAYGAARYEKGSDLLQSAIHAYLEQHPDTQAEFAIQWLGDFEDESGQLVTKDPWLEQKSNFEFISAYFEDGGYMKKVAQTDVLLLPYRSNYALRVSRVVIEAMILGIPVIATRGTTLQQQAAEFGTVITCEPDSVESLTSAIANAVANLDKLKQDAGRRSKFAREHFSVNTFCKKFENACKIVSSTKPV